MEKSKRRSIWDVFKGSEEDKSLQTEAGLATAGNPIT